MPSKTFDEILNNLPAEDKAKIDQAKPMVSNGQETKSSETTQHSTPGDTYKDAHRTAAPTTGNSATMSEISNKPTTATTPPEPDTQKPTL